MKKVISIILSLLISTIIASFSACADENNVSFTDEKSSESIVEETIIPTEATEENATEENQSESNEVVDAGSQITAFSLEQQNMLETLYPDY